MNTFKQYTTQTLFVVFFSFCFLQTAYSQDNYLPGHIITLDGEKLAGYINYLNWGKNPQKISFRKQAEGKKIRYAPTDIKEFGVEDEVYVSAIVDTEVSPVKVGYLEYNPNLNIKRDTVFLQKMIGGEKSLYYFKSSKDKENFYIQEGNSSS